MGLQVGLIFIAGQFGHTQAYMDGTIGRVRMVVPVSKQKILTDDSYDLMRKNMSEFSACSLAADTIFRVTGETGRSYMERYFRGGLIKKFQTMVKAGPGLNGQRSLEVSNHKDQLRELELNRKEPFGNQFRADFTLTANTDRNEVTATVPAFNTKWLMDAPRGATHFRLTLSIGVISDFIYTGLETGYEPSQPTLNKKNAVTYSALMQGNGVTSLPFQMVATLPGSPVLPADASLVACVGVEFFKVVGGVAELFASGNAMQIRDVF